MHNKSYGAGVERSICWVQAVLSSRLFLQAAFPFQRPGHADGSDHLEGSVSTAPASNRERDLSSNYTTVAEAAEASLKNPHSEWSVPTPYSWCFPTVWVGHFPKKVSKIKIPRGQSSALLYQLHPAPSPLPTGDTSHFPGTSARRAF